MSLTRADLESTELHKRLLQSKSGVQFLSEAELQASIEQTLQQQKLDADIWLFAYGSLIWNPLFKFVEHRSGTIYGWHRRFCLWTPWGRGTPDNPGLVLGLDRGGSCRGVAFRLDAATVATELIIVWRREMIVNTYIPRWVRVLDGKQGFDAIAFVVNRNHRAYVGNISWETTVNSIATAQGQLGSSADYLMQTIEGLAAAGIRDKHLLQLGASVLEQRCIPHF
jgi:cation transport protein ChaC